MSLPAEPATQARDAAQLAEAYKEQLADSTRAAAAPGERAGGGLGMREWLMKRMARIRQPRQPTGTLVLQDIRPAEPALVCERISASAKTGKCDCCP